MKVRWLLAELGPENVSFDHVPAGGSSDLIGAAYRAINPSGLVPCLVLDTKELLAESNSILRYVCDAVKAEELGGRNAVERALISRWQDYSLGTVEIAMKSIYFHEVRNVKLSDNDLQAAVRTVTQTWLLLDQHLEGKQWICAQRFTLAEITLGAQVHRYFQLQCTKEARVPLKNLQALYARLCERPAFQKVVLAEPLI